jgi:predicted component of type VI protein secretion system
MKKTFLMCVVLSVLQFGCGSTDGLLATSSVSGTLDIFSLDSDVIKWTTQASCTGPTTIPAADSVNVTVTSKANANTGTNGLPFRVNQIRIIYTPANTTTPPLATEYQAINAQVANGASLSIPVRIATIEQKQVFQQVLACQSPVYAYYVTILIDVAEIGSEKSQTIDLKMNLRFADFTDK